MRKLLEEFDLILAETADKGAEIRDELTSYERLTLSAQILSASYLAIIARASVEAMEDSESEAADAIAEIISEFQAGSHGR